jgi:hypothetical protein
MVMGAFSRGTRVQSIEVEAYTGSEFPAWVPCEELGFVVTWGVAVVPLQYIQRGFSLEGSSPDRPPTMGYKPCKAEGHERKGCLLEESR